MCQIVHIHLPFSLQQNYLFDLHKPGKIGHLTEIACLRVTELNLPECLYTQIVLSWTCPLYLTADL